MCSDPYCHYAEELRRLKAEIFNKAWQAPPELKLTAMQERMVGVLLKHNRVIPAWLLFESTRGAGTLVDEARSDRDLIQAVVCLIRRKFGRHGLQIETFRGRGYRLSPESRQKLLNWNTTSSVAA